MTVSYDESAVLATPKSGQYQIDAERSLTRLANELYYADLSPEARKEALAQSIDGYAEARPIVKEAQPCIVVAMPCDAEEGGWPDFKHGDLVLCATKDVNEWRRLGSAAGGRASGEMLLLDHSGARAVSVPASSLVTFIPVDEIVAVLADAEQMS